MNAEKEIFRRKKLIPSKLQPYGFVDDGDCFTFRKTLAQSGLALTVKITPAGEISTEITDPATEDAYTLHLTDGAVGSFVAGVRADYAQILADIASHCFEPEIFKSFQTKQLVEYVGDHYGDEPEYLWKKFTDNAVWRRKDTGKWYGAILTVSRRKLGLDSDEIAEILDFRCPPEELDALADGKLYFRGWHMNKKSWCTIVLDGSVSTEEICRRIDKSYSLANK